MLSLQDIYKAIVLRIVTQQADLVGTLAWEVVEQVDGLSITNILKREIEITGEPKEVINVLVEKYQKLFGKMAKDVCKDCVADIIVEMDSDDIPDYLK